MSQRAVPECNAPADMLAPAAFGAGFPGRSFAGCLIFQAGNVVKCQGASAVESKLATGALHPTLNSLKSAKKACPSGKLCLPAGDFRVVWGDISNLLFVVKSFV